MMEEKLLLYQSNVIHYKLIGSGEPLILLHGYSADGRIWNKISPLLESKYQLIIPDFPGHGKSKVIYNINTMDFLAEIVYKLCLSLGIQSVRIAGHSMGGYVALAFAEKYTNMLEGLYLINSHPFADNMTKTLARNREADIIVSGRKHLLFLSFAEKNFYADNHKKLTSEINELSVISYNQPESGMLADLAGMMARSGRSHAIRNTRYPVHFIVGEDDDKVPLGIYDSIEGKNINIHRLKHCGHFCLIEKTRQTADIILRD